MAPSGGDYFYSKSNMKVFMNTKAKFTEEEYIMNHIIRDMNEWTKKTEFPSIQDNVIPVDSQPLISDIDTPIILHRIGPVKLTLMGESSLTLLDSHKDDPTGYYKAINDKDSNFWKEAKKSELESMFSNNV